ncbi:hypothetical protein DFH09DRAFT_1322367 [Mycena vulgaris]|nr:hypothetical protein DFH09DRAFT_1322367 [Mycena vulgaris]
MDELNSFPYLEIVVREAMQLSAPLVPTQHMAMEDDALPLWKPYIDIRQIPKGQLIHIPILAVNTDTGMRGSDAWEFKPER